MGTCEHCGTVCTGGLWCQGEWRDAVYICSLCFDAAFPSTGRAKQVTPETTTKTPPALLRRAADLMDRAHASADRDLLGEAGSIVDMVADGIREALDPVTAAR